MAGLGILILYVNTNGYKLTNSLNPLIKHRCRAKQSVHQFWYEPNQDAIIFSCFDDAQFSLKVSQLASINGVDPPETTEELYNIFCNFFIGSEF